MSSKNPSTVPGLEPTSEDDGNLCDIANAGSLHEFLLGLHKQFGPIASFWWGGLYVVSIASADLFEEHRHLFDRPPELFEMFLPLLGLKSIQYADQEEGRARRNHYDKALAKEQLKKFFPAIQAVAEEVAGKWSELLDEPKIPLSQYTCMFSLKAVLLTLFGNIMKAEKEVLDFKKAYDVVWSEMELRLVQFPTEEREEALQQGKKYLQEIIQKMITDRKANPPKPGEELMLDSFITFSDDEELQLADALCFIVGGFHTTGFLLTWAIYYLAKYPEVDKKLYGEIKEVLGNDDVNALNIGELVYLRQVLDETLRCSIVAPWAARYQDTESTLGGHRIPKSTPVIHALGVAFKDEKTWPDPEKFDPERFNKENSQQRHRLWFSPFGFAGKRECPAQHYSYAEATVALVTLLRKFKVHMSDEGQVVTPVYGLVTRPKDEIWISLSKR